MNHNYSLFAMSMNSVTVKIPQIESELQCVAYTDFSDSVYETELSFMAAIFQLQLGNNGSRIYRHLRMAKKKYVKQGRKSEF